MLKEFLASLHPSLAVLDGVPMWVFAIVVVLTAVVLLGYLLKGGQVGWQLWMSVRRIGALTRTGSGPVKPEDVAKVLRWKPASHLWDEYSDTLHELKRASNGELSVTEIRATVPAETYFTRDVLVDSRLLDDFSRHVPGVLTGLGIIGTFAGLLDGLASFNPSSPEAAVAGLKPLMNGVEHAFIASATAIGCAMLVLFAGRLMLAWLYRLVEKLVHGIDALYATGAGEEYLSRLVHASEKNEAHAAQLKEALVEDLSKLMTNLTERQIQAQSSASQLLGEHIGNTISNSLAEPLQKMTESMTVTSRGNSEAVSGMLETMLAGFMAKLEDTFGGQMRGINEQMSQSMAAMASVQASLKELVEDIGRTNKTASEEMSNKLADAMKDATANQNLLTEQMRQFVTEFRGLVNDEQEKARAAMDASVQEVLSKVASAVEHLEAVRTAAAADEQRRGERLVQESTSLIEGLSGNVDNLLQTVSEQVLQTQRNIDELAKVSMTAISGMNQGASQMETAAERFKQAGSAVTGVLEHSAHVSQQMSSTASTLQSAAAVAKQGLDQYEQTRRAVDGYVATLAGLLENAKQEAGLTKEMLRDLERIVQELRKAEEQSKEYFQHLNGALEGAFRTFGSELTTQVKDTIATTDRHLSNGVGQLTGVVQALQMALARLKKA
ncbi:anti-phage ZorAB system protein ZorA [Thauera sp. SWB20]|uniref:anti-phage ZorAB system protein ZorA n=1 Tax=Thauera sp. SWB20 TaxID=1572758 RepID=UPI0005ADF617|nr:anti-phage ZorAB system protein ZorA [Thauera sp. SWB20]KIN89757.1 putative methyl-accepting chemotaxis sensory transducer [Thauera sp. SWB20]